MKIYYDTEFTTLDGNVDWDMISAGFVAENGREWYVEITDFLREDCSDFVVETVLPLLGNGDFLPERMAGVEFADWLCAWLSEFGEDIELVSDATCDWWLILSYASKVLKALPFAVTSTVWASSRDSEFSDELRTVEADFWAANPGMQHHALYDARRLKLIAQTAQLDWSDKKRFANPKELPCQKHSPTTLV